MFTILQLQHLVTTWNFILINIQSLIKCGQRFEIKKFVTIKFYLIIDLLFNTTHPRALYLCKSINTSPYLSAHSSKRSITSVHIHTRSHPKRYTRNRKSQVGLCVYLYNAPSRTRIHRGVCIFIAKREAHPGVWVTIQSTHAQSRDYCSRVRARPRWCSNCRAAKKWSLRYDCTHTPEWHCVPVANRFSNWTRVRA